MDYNTQRFHSSPDSFTSSEFFEKEQGKLQFETVQSTDKVPGDAFEFI